MTGLVRRATLITAVGLLAAAAAYAGVPSAGTSTLGTIIQLGGTAGGVADLRCEKVITVRDAANNPVPNSVVVVNFSACYANEIRIASTQPFAGTFVNCAARTVSTVTNASGVATLRIVGASNVLGSGDAGAPEGCATVTADGVALGSLSVSTADENGAAAGGAGVTGVDNVLYSGNRFGGAALYRPRSNFTGVAGTIDGTDTVIFTGYRFGGGSTTNGPFCP